MKHRLRTTISRLADRLIFRPIERQAGRCWGDAR